MSCHPQRLYLTTCLAVCPLKAIREPDAVIPKKNRNAAAPVRYTYLLLTSAKRSFVAFVFIMQFCEIDRKLDNRIELRYLLLIFRSGNKRTAAFDLATLIKERRALENARERERFSDHNDLATFHYDVVILSLFITFLYRLSTHHVLSRS